MAEYTEKELEKDKEKEQMREKTFAESFGLNNR